MEQIKNEKWIWLDKKRYPEFQNTYISAFLEDKKGYNYCVAEFCGNFVMPKKVVKLDIRASGDTSFRLWLNECFIGEGPVNESRDYDDALPFANKRYANSYTVYPDSYELHFYADVQLSPLQLNQYSRGHGGFMLSAKAYFEDGTYEYIYTDESWLSRVNRRYIAPYDYDNTMPVDEWGMSNVIENIWNTVDSPIPMLSIEKIKPVSDTELEVKAGAEQVYNVFFDKIYSAHVAFDIECSGECSINIKCYEKSLYRYSTEQIKTDSSMTFRGFELHSIGAYEIRVKNGSNEPARIKPYAMFVCYPVKEEGFFRCSDSDMNKVFDVCKWTTRICRQTMHLDSPAHQEPLACTGDYYIESLISAFCFGDMRLAEFDVIKTAELLRNRDGKMFHTTYSLIWVQMLYDVYMFCGNREMLEECIDALEILLDRFAGYIGQNGIVENAPDYMFVDWVVEDGYSLHHPPKALGQTCLNAYYYGALITAAKICAETGRESMASDYNKQASLLKKAFNENLYDAKRGLYFAGLNTPNEQCLWLPQNSSKRYYTKHCNTLAVLFGLCNEYQGAEIMKRIINDDTLGDVQPYFMHFVLCALRRVGLFEEYGFAALERWKALVNDFGKGLQEGWIKPQPGYSFDYSHAWGGTPAYQLPKALLGLEIIEAGYKKIILRPRLYHYDYVFISVPTPFGYIMCNMEKGKEPQIVVPAGIDYKIE